MALTPWHLRDIRFGAAGRGELGYDEREVDAFLIRVEAALVGHRGLTAAEVAAARFTECRHRGYPAAAVDAFLDEVALTLAEQGEWRPATGDDSIPPWARAATAPGAVTTPPIAVRPPVREVAPSALLTGSRPGEPAVDQSEVDALLDRIEATLGGLDTLSAHDVLTATFNPPPPGRPGYGRSGVQAFLVLAGTSLTKLGRNTVRAGARPIGPVPAPPLPVTSAPPASGTPGPNARRPRRLLPHDAPTPWPPTERRTRRAAEPRPAVSPAAEPAPLTRDEIHDVRLRPAQASAPGYAEGEVDALLDRVEATLAGSDVLTAEHVRAVRFHELPPGLGGYDRREVDALLDLVEERLEALGRRPA